jgi:hypothetical protein
MCPYTLTHNKMLASTMQHSTHNHTPTPQPPPHPPHQQLQGRRVRRSGQKRPPRTQPNRASSQDPTACRAHVLHNLAIVFHPATPTTHTPTCADSCPGMESVKGDPETFRASEHLTTTVRLLRKEVIQPHLPVRLPCYDFVPIASPTFDNSLPQGVRPSASGVTNFRDVTGGVYKARERIHRSVADLRLLATPTSRGRVADPDPN